MLTLRKSGERGQTVLGGLMSRHTFSFGSYQDRDHHCFGALRVLNEDIVSPGAEAMRLPHRDMDILVYVLAGAIQHRDRSGQSILLRPGEILRTDAFDDPVNASGDIPAHMLVLGIVASGERRSHMTQHKQIDADSVWNKFARIASCEPLPNEVPLSQDSEIWLAQFHGEEEAIHSMQPGRKAWLQVLKGSVDVNGEDLSSGDAAAISDEDVISVRTRAPSEVLILDLA